MNSLITITPSTDPRTGRIAIVSLLLLLGSLFLSAVSSFSNVRSTVGYGWPWCVLFGTLLVALFATMLVVIFRLRHNITIDAGGGVLTKTGILCVIFLVYAWFAAEAAFSGVPIVLHHFSSRNGQMTVTVAAKRDTLLKWTCRPRVLVKELSYFAKHYLCVDERTFRQIDVGQKIRVTGRVSPFGIEPDQIYWQAKGG